MRPCVRKNNIERSGCKKQELHSFQVKLRYTAKINSLVCQSVGRYNVTFTSLIINKFSDLRFISIQSWLANEIKIFFFVIAALILSA